MTESDYWPHLEHRVTRELAGMNDQALRSLWCDGFIPERYSVSGVDPHITGVAWICDGPKQNRWEFRLDLHHPVSGPENIPWADLLPAEERTDWLDIDEDSRKIRISLGAPRSGSQV